jgi:serine/arginine repetitive matrix protein 2
MYNGIGLSTPRGSGTSGYVSANKALVSKQKSRLDFIKEMKALRANILPPPRKANKDILDHNQKRQIYVKLAEIRETLESSDKNFSEEEITKILKESEAKLIENFEKGKLSGNGNNDSHALAAAKEK